MRYKYTCITTTCISLSITSLNSTQLYSTQLNSTQLNSNLLYIMATSPKAPLEGIDFEDLPWNLNLPEEHSYVHIKTAPGTSDWTEEHYNSATDEGLIVTSIYKYSDTPLGVYPSTTSLNYGTTIWEGLKCYRDANDMPTVFRPDMNHKRFCNGCHAMALPPPSFELFMRGIQTALHANSHLIPPKGDGMKLYVRRKCHFVIAV